MQESSSVRDRASNGKKKFWLGFRHCFVPRLKWPVRA